jgi:ribose/xylose/arabinose/galactoside ABC-type transport system permease subunit
MSVLQRDRGLRGEQLQHRDPGRDKDPGSEIVLEVEHTNELALIEQRQAENGAGLVPADIGIRGKRVRVHGIVENDALPGALDKVKNQLRQHGRGHRLIAQLHDDRVVLAGAVVGLLNAALIVRARIPDLVATLASMFLVNGLTLIGVSGQSVAEGMLVNGEQVTGVFAPIFKWLGSESFFNVPASVVLSGLVFIVVYVLLNLTRWGRAFYAVGGNPIAAAAVGIRVQKYRSLAYIFFGSLAAIAGLLLAARSNRGDVGVGDAYLLQAVSAALVGFAVLGANKANAFGTLIGAVFVATLINGLRCSISRTTRRTLSRGALLVVALLMSYTLGPKLR